MIIYLLMLSSFLFLLSKPALAVCPVCTVAVGAGVGLSRWLGIDDTVSGLWIGGLIVSSSLWLTSWLGKRKIKLPYKWLLPLVSFYVLTILPLYFSGIIGHVFNTFLGIDKLILGTAVGLLVFVGAVGLDKYLRLTNHGKVCFYYQKVILPVSFLLVFSFIFYFLTKRF